MVPFYSKRDWNVTWRKNNQRQWNFLQEGRAENLTPFWDVCLDSRVAKFSVSHIVQRKRKRIRWSDGKLSDGKRIRVSLLNSQLPMKCESIMSPEKTEKMKCQDYTAGQTRRYRYRRRYCEDSARSSVGRGSWSRQGSWEICKGNKSLIGGAHWSHLHFMTELDELQWQLKSTKKRCL